MNSDVCTLHLSIIFKDKSFNINSENLITIKEIKEKAAEYFNIKEKDKNDIKLFLKNGEKNLFIYSEIDIIENTDDSDINNPKLNLHLLIESKEQNIKEQLIPKTNSIPTSEKLISNDDVFEKKIIKDIKNINGNNEVKNDKKLEYNDLKKIIDNLTNEINLLKAEQFNKFKNFEQTILNKQVESNEKFQLMLKTEYNKIKDENEKYFKTNEELNEIKNNEINELKESVQKIMKDIKDNNDIQKGIYNDIFGNLNNNLESKIKTFQQEFNKLINEEKKNSNNLIERMDNNEKEIKNLKDNNLNIKNEFENFKNQISLNLNQQNVNFKILINSEYNKIKDENEKYFKNNEELNIKKNIEINELKESVQKIIKNIKDNNDIQKGINENIVDNFNRNLESKIKELEQKFFKLLNDVQQNSIDLIKRLDKNEKEIKTLKDKNLNIKNEFENYKNQNSCNSNQQNEYFKNLINIEYKKIDEENKNFYKNIQSEINELKDLIGKNKTEINNNYEKIININRELMQISNSKLDIEEKINNFVKELSNINNLSQKLEKQIKEQDEKMNYMIYKDNIIQNLVNKINIIEKEIKIQNNSNNSSNNSKSIHENVNKSNKNIIIEENSDNNINKDEEFFFNKNSSQNSKIIKDVNKDNNIDNNQNNFFLTQHSQDNILFNNSNNKIDIKSEQTKKEINKKNIMELQEKFPNLKEKADEEIQSILDNYNGDLKKAIIDLTLRSTK